MSAVSEFQLRNQLPELRRANDLVQAFSQANDLPQIVVQALDLSLTEWITNIISYGYADSAEHLIQVRLEIVNGTVRAEVTDDASPFNPLTHPPVDTNAPLETRAIGGLGIHMMRRLMDAVDYRREGTRNIVTMSKSAAGMKK